MRILKSNLSGWGNYPIEECALWRPEKQRDLVLGDQSSLARGLGRSYGDAALNQGEKVILMERLNRMLDFDQETGLLRAEAGLSLKEIVEVFVPRGWFLPVTPGTKYVTFGGAIAADVHGKNHHRDGTFGQHVKELELLVADGSRIRCGPEQNKEIFWATVGGMGLTGVITEATVQLIPITTAYVRVKNHPCPNLKALLECLSDKAYDDHYSVAWIDCLSVGEHFGRSVLMTAHHATVNELSEKMKSEPLLYKEKKQHSVPFFLPGAVLNTYSIKAFNACYYAAQSKKVDPFISHLDDYFYPLDAVEHWNRCYGKKGFLQYQFVLPFKNGAEALEEILKKLTEKECASFLAVLKKFGPENQGPLSFPFEGYTLALDIPIKNREIFSFLDQLDQIVIQNGGRVYLAKDARMKGETFKQMYPKFNQWLAIKEKIDPDWKFNSSLARRLEMENRT